MRATFIDKQGCLITVDRAAYENFTFYRKRTFSHRGSRVRVRSIPNFYPTSEAAEAALIEYAKTRKDWKPYAGV